MGYHRCYALIPETCVVTLPGKSLGIIKVTNLDI